MTDNYPREMFNTPGRSCSLHGGSLPEGYNTTAVPSQSACNTPAWPHLSGLSQSRNDEEREPCLRRGQPTRQAPDPAEDPLVSTTVGALVLHVQEECLCRGLDRTASWLGELLESGDEGILNELATVPLACAKGSRHGGDAPSPITTAFFGDIKSDVNCYFSFTNAAPPATSPVPVPAAGSLVLSEGGHSAAEDCRPSTFFNLSPTECSYYNSALAAFHSGELRRAHHILAVKALGQCPKTGRMAALAFCDRRAAFLCGYALYLDGERLKRNLLSGTGSVLASADVAGAENPCLEATLVFTDEALRRFPDDGYLLWLRGIVLREMRLTQRSVACLVDAVRQNPLLWCAWEDLSAALTHVAQLAEVLQSTAEATQDLVFLRLIFAARANKELGLYLDAMRILDLLLSPKGGVIASFDEEEAKKAVASEGHDKVDWDAPAGSDASLNGSVVHNTAGASVLPPPGASPVPRVVPAPGMLDISAIASLSGSPQGRYSSCRRVLRRAFTESVARGTSVSAGIAAAAAAAAVVTTGAALGSSNDIQGTGSITAANNATLIDVPYEEHDTSTHIMEELSVLPLADTSSANTTIQPSRVQVFFPSHPSLMALLALCQSERKQHDAARNTFAALYRADPMRLDDVDEYSSILFLLGDSAALARLAEESFALDPFRAESNVAVGNYYAQLQKHGKSIYYFKRATQLNVRCLSAYILLGHAFVEVKNSAAAEEAYRAALRVDPRYYIGWYSLGTIYELLRGHHHALHYYWQATQRRPHDSRVWQATADCLKKLNRYAEATRCLENAERCEAGTSEGYANLLRELIAAFIKEGKFPRAVLYMGKLMACPSRSEADEREFLHLMLEYKLGVVGNGLPIHSRAPSIGVTESLPAGAISQQQRAEKLAQLADIRQCYQRLMEHLARTGDMPNGDPQIRKKMPDYEKRISFYNKFLNRAF